MKEKKLQDNVVVNEKLMGCSVIQNGLQNKFDAIDEKFRRLHENFKTETTEINRNSLDEIKAELKREKKVLRSEISQINKLNRKPKGKMIYPYDDEVVLKVVNANKIYTTERNTFQALKNANVSFKRGSFNVILGPSGSGKTTLLNIISGLDRATFGEVIINDTNIQALSTRLMTQFRRKYIGFVFQSYNLLPSLNVNDNIEVGRSLQKDQNKKQDISNLLNEMDMLHNKKKMTYELSGGQQQRVSVARALAKSPDILIGDEPTGALDEKTAIKVLELFQQINAQFNTTIIIVTHNPRVAMLANQVIHVKDGQIAKVVVNDNPMPASYLGEETDLNVGRSHEKSI